MPTQHYVSIALPAYHVVHLPPHVSLHAGMAFLQLAVRSLDFPTLNLVYEKVAWLLPERYRKMSDCQMFRRLGRAGAKILE